MHVLAGKNRPLDEEELQFMDAVEAAQREKDRAAREEEEAALDAFQQVKSGLGCSWCCKRCMRTPPERQWAVLGSYPDEGACAASACMRHEGGQCGAWRAAAAAGGEGGS
jgi:hypothetical protein